MMTFNEARVKLECLAGENAWSITYQESSYNELPCGVYIAGLNHGHFQGETFDEAFQRLNETFPHSQSEVLEGTPVGETK